VTGLLLNARRQELLFWRTPTGAFEGVVVGRRLGGLPYHDLGCNGDNHHSRNDRADNERVHGFSPFHGCSTAPRVPPLHIHVTQDADAVLSRWMRLFKLPLLPPFLN